MYCKLFASLYQGTLRGKSNEILVFTNLLATCDKEGFVDKHFKSIAEEVGLTMEQVKLAILNLEAPDPESRSQELEGSRLERIEGHRDWGWRIVNYVKYSQILNAEERREYNKLRQREYRANKKDGDSHKMSMTVIDKPHLSQMCTHIDVHADVHADVGKNIAVSATPQQPITQIGKKRTVHLCDESFISELRLIYLNIDIDAQIQKMKAWLLTPKGRGKKLTRQFVVNWLNRCDIPIQVSQPKKDPPKGFN